MLKLTSATIGKKYWVKVFKFCSNAVCAYQLIQFIYSVPYKGWIVCVVGCLRNRSQGLNSTYACKPKTLSRSMRYLLFWEITSFLRIRRAQIRSSTLRIKRTLVKDQLHSPKLMRLYPILWKWALRKNKLYLTQARRKILTMNS